MTDLSTSTQALLSQAMAQLNKTAPSSDIAKQGVEVLVKHLTGNVLSLQKPATLLPKTVLLNNPEIRGTLNNGQNHQIKLALSTNNSTPSTVEFFSSASTKTNIVVALTQQQLQTILNLPASQLVTKVAQQSSTVLTQLANLPAVVLSSPMRISESGVPANTQDPQKNPADPKQNTLRLAIVNQQPPLEVSLPTKQPPRFAQGEKVSVELIPKGVNWQVNVKSLVQSNAHSPSHENGAKAIQLQSQPSLAREVPIEKTNKALNLSGPVEIQQQKNQQVLVSPQIANPLIKAGLQDPTSTKPVFIELATKTVIALLNKSSTEQNLALTQKVQAAQVDTLTLQLKPNGEASLLAEKRQPVASIVINKEIAQALIPLKLPNQHVLQNLTHTEPQKFSGTLPHTEKVTAEQTTIASLKQPPLVTSEQQIKSSSHTLNADLTGKENARLAPDAAKEIHSGAHKPTVPTQGENQLVQNLVTPNLLSNKSEQIQLIQNLLRLVQAKAEVPAVALASIEKALSDPEFFKDANDKPTKQIVEQVVQQLKQGLPQGKEHDVNQIRQLLAAPPLSLSTVQLVTPSANQGMLAGLVTLLQMSLSARLMRNQSNRTDQVVSTLNTVLRNKVSSTNPTTTAKSLSDLSQLEQKHQLLREIGRLLAGHQTNKLNSAEQALQGQESLYYNLPSALGGNIKDVEVLIKREPPPDQQKQDKEAAKQAWHLTMKLSVGEMGELLTKAKLRQDNLEINFYASNQEVNLQVLNFLPLLRKKLQGLGIEVCKSQCQLGKIPETLQIRPHHAFQAKA